MFQNTCSFPSFLDCITQKVCAIEILVLQKNKTKKTDLDFYCFIKRYEEINNFMVLNKCYKSKHTKNLRLLWTLNTTVVRIIAVIVLWYSAVTALQTESFKGDFRSPSDLPSFSPATLNPLDINSGPHRGYFGRVCSKLEQQNSKTSAGASNQ